MTDIVKQSARLGRRIKSLSNKVIPVATASALNKSAQRIKTRVVRGVSNDAQVKQSVLRKRMFIRPARAKTGKATFRVYRRDITARSLLSEKKLLANVGSGTNRKGVRVAGRQIAGAFVARLKERNSQIHVMRRREKSRYPIDVVRIPVYKSVDRIAKKVAARVMNDQFPALLQHELNFRFTRITEKSK